MLTIVAFTMERFLAICHPLHLYTMSGFKRAIRIIAALWCISFLSALPFAVHTKIYYARYPLGECALCFVDFVVAFRQERIYFNCEILGGQQ